MTSPDVDRLVAGAPVLWPAVIVGDRLLHLARAEARRKATPVLLGICPQLRDVVLEPAPRPRRFRRRRKWCRECGRYRQHLLLTARHGEQARSAEL